MGLYTAITRQWLERRFQRRSDAGVYFAHQPVYGLGHPDCEGGHPARLARMLHLLRALDGLGVRTLLDVGGAEGWLAHLAQELLGIRAINCDLSVQACARARELFALPAAAVDCGALPFADGAFDAVVCSEVIEHVEQPVATLLELQRVARVAVLLTTEEVRHDRQEIDEYLFRRPGWPHMERNLFHPDDLRDAFPGEVARCAQSDVPPPRELEPAALPGWLLQHARGQPCVPGSHGIVVQALRQPDARRPRRHDDATLVQRLLACTVPAVARPAVTAPPEPWLLDLLRCPRDGSPLRLQGDALVSADGARYPVADGVPDLLVGDGAAPTRDELARRAAGRCPPGQAAALVALHDRLDLPERCERSSFDFTQRQHRRGFWPNEQLVPRPGGAGFAWHSTGADPWLLTPCLQRPVREVELVLRVHNPDLPVPAGEGQVFWQGPDDATMGEDRSVLFRVPNDGKVHRHRVVLADHPRAPGLVQWLRLDLINGPCEVDLLGLELR